MKGAVRRPRAFLSKVYRRQTEAIIRRFTYFCGLVGIDPLLDVFGAIVGFFSRSRHLIPPHPRGMKPAPLFANFQNTLGPIRRWYIEQGFPDPLDDRAILLRLRRFKANSSMTRRVPVLTRDQLRTVLDHKPRTLAEIRNRALFELVYTSRLFATELCSLSVTDIRRVPLGIELRLPKRKVTVRCVPGSPYCPVAAMDSWLRVRPGNSEWAFVRTHVTQGNRLSPTAIADGISSYIKQSGVPGVFSAFSLHGTAVVMLAQRGVPPSEIQLIRGYSSIAFVYRWLEQRDPESPYGPNDHSWTPLEMERESVEPAVGQPEQQDNELPDKPNA